MKIYHLFYITSLLINTACLEDRSFEIPFLKQQGLLIPDDQIVTIPALKMAWEQESNQELYPFLRLTQGYEDKFLEGYVISDDQQGNYYKAFFIQDDPESPQAGIKVLLDQTDISQRYDVGRRVLIQLSGLTVGLSSGVFALGLEDGGALSLVPTTHNGGVVQRDTLVSPISARTLNMENLGPQHTNMWIELSHTQFHRFQSLSLPPMTFAADAMDQYDGERWLEQCASGQYLVLKTSTYADFNTAVLPSDDFTIYGILQYDYFGEYFVLVINGPDDIVMGNSGRCDPLVLDCGPAPGLHPIVWGESFNQRENLSALMDSGWWAPDTNSEALLWSIGSYGGNKYLQITAEASDIALHESWLISPPLSKSVLGEILSIECDIQANFQRGIPLSFWITEQDPQDYSIDVQWDLLNYFIPNGPSDGFGDFKTMGPIDISCKTGETFYLGLRYKQRSVFDTTRYHIDNLRIRSP